MEVDILPENLSKAATLLARVTPGRTSLPILANLLLETNQGRLAVTATDLELHATLHVGAQVHQEGAIALPAKTLSKMISKLPDEKLNLSTNGENRATFQQDQRSLILDGQPADDFPPTPEHGEHTGTDPLLIRAVTPKTKLHIPTAAKQTWETPVKTFKYLDERFGPFDLDAACLPDQLTAMTILARGGRILIPVIETIPNRDPAIADWSDHVISRIQEDGLTSPWNGKCVWLNPPFNDLANWLARAIHEVEEGIPDLVCVLMPSRTDTKYWQEYVIREVRRNTAYSNAPENRWNVEAHPALHTVVNLPGRLTFIGADAPFTQPCCAVIYGDYHDVKDKEHPL